MALSGLMSLAQSVFLATNNTLIIVAAPDELRGGVPGDVGLYHDLGD